MPLTETEGAPQNNKDAEQADAPAGASDPAALDNPSGPQQAPTRAPGCGSATLAALTASGTVTKWNAAQSPASSFSPGRSVTTPSSLAGATSMALDDDEAIFAVGGDGKLRRYASTAGGYSAGTALGSGFSATTQVLSAGHGVIYTIAKDGTLRWYRYGSEDWAWDDKGKVVGSGWNTFTKVFSGGDGILYAVTKDGDLMWYRHGDPGLGANVWEGPVKVGVSWQNFTQLSGVGEGVIYALLPNGTLRYYQHLGYEDGSWSWAASHGTVVSTGLSAHTRLTSTPRACLAAGRAPRPPKRGNSNRRAVYLVHGFGLTWSGAFDCDAYWGAFVQGLRAKGWKGPIRTVQLYKGDTNCDVSAYKGDLDTDIESLGLGLARVINRTHPGSSADVIGHSMGGLVVRYAIQGVAQRRAGWPSFVNIEDAVTIDTPQQGVYCPFDFWNQCRQITPGSAFLRALLPQPQAATGTDWTAMGHADDWIVPWETSTGADNKRKAYLGPGHFVYYYSRNYSHRSAHMDVLGKGGKNTFRAWHWDYHQKRLAPTYDETKTSTIDVGGTKWSGARRFWRAPDPIDWAYNAIYSWDTW